MLAWIAGAAGLAAVGVASYGAVAPESELFGKTLHRLADRRQIALTYDDGPNDPHTLNLLDVLAKHDVKATFFLIGKHVAARPDIVRRIASEFHQIGNHTYNHPNLLFCSEKTVEKELNDCHSALRDVVGDYVHKTIEQTQPFRPPYGARSPAVMRVTRRLGYYPVLWNVTCYDWKKTTPTRVEAHALRQISSGDIVLMHDGGPAAIGADRSHTVEATRRLIQRFKAHREFVVLGSGR